MAKTNGLFVSLHDPIIAPEEVNHMVDVCKLSLPVPWMIMMQLLGQTRNYYKKDGCVKTTKAHLHKTFEHVTLFILMSLSHVQFNQNFAYWLCILLAVSYGLLVIDVAQCIT